MDETKKNILIFGRPFVDTMYVSYSYKNGIKNSDWREGRQQIQKVTTHKSKTKKKLSILPPTTIDVVKDSYTKQFVSLLLQGIPYIIDEFRIFCSKYSLTIERKSEHLYLFRRICILRLVFKVCVACNKGPHIIYM